MTETPETPAARPSIWAILAAYFAPALVLLAIVVPFLRFHQYSLLLPESLILVGGAAIIGLGLGALGRLRPQSLPPLLIALTLCVYLFFRHEVSSAFLKAAVWISDIVGYPSIVLALMGVTVFLVIVPFCVLTRRHLETIVAAIFGTIVVTTIVLPVETGGAPVEVGELPKQLKDLPPVVHIILDEHISPSGLPSDFAESPTARQAIDATFRDFKLYTHVFSRFAETKYSLTSMMNGDRGADIGEILKGEGSVFTPTENAWIDRLKSEGYAVKVYQSTWFDICGSTASVDACYTYSFFSPNAIQRSSLSTEQRLRALLENLIFGAESLELGPLVSTRDAGAFPQRHR